jgi:DNA-binding transcriptional LysR family regulator
MSASVKTLETFIELYKTKNLRVTAKKMGITQPTVTYRIQELESYLGQKLIITQNSRQMSFTSYAESIYPELSHIVDELHYIKRTGETKPFKNDIKIVAGEIAGLYFLPSVVKNFKDKYKFINVNLEINSSLNVIRSIKTGNADIGFVASKQFPEFKEIKDYIKIERLIPVELIVITPKDHPFAKKGSVTPLEIVESNENYISRSETSGIQYEFKRILKEDKIKFGDLNIVQKFENSSSVISAVTEGLGISIVSWYQAYKFVNAGLIDYAKLTTNVKSYLYGLDRWNEKFVSINNFMNMTKLYLASLSRSMYATKSL